MSAMTELEERISTTLHSYGESVVVPPAFTTRVLAGGRRRQQRRRLLSAVVAVATVVVIAGGIAVTKPFATSVPTPAPAAPSTSKALTPLPGVPATPPKLDPLDVSALPAGAAPGIPLVVQGDGVSEVRYGADHTWKIDGAQNPVVGVSDDAVIARVSGPFDDPKLIYHSPRGDVVLDTVTTKPGAVGSNSIGSAIVSTDGKQVAWSTTEGAIKLADLPSGKIRSTFDASGLGQPRLVAIVDGDPVFSGVAKTGAATYFRWDPALDTATPIVVSGQVKGTVGAAISTTADSLIVPSLTGRCVVSYSLVDPSSRRWQACFDVARYPVPSISPDGTRVAVPFSKGSTSTVEVLDAATGKVAARRGFTTTGGLSLRTESMWEADGHLLVAYQSKSGSAALRCTPDLVTCERAVTTGQILTFGARPGDRAPMNLL